MSSISHLTNLLVGLSIDEENLLYEIYVLIKEVCAEVVPQIVKEELQKSQQDFTINVIPEINGKRADFHGLQDDIRKLFEEQIAKMK